MPLLKWKDRFKINFKEYQHQAVHGVHRINSPLSKAAVAVITVDLSSPTGVLDDLQKAISDYQGELRSGQHEVPLVIACTESDKLDDGVKKKKMAEIESWAATQAEKLSQTINCIDTSTVNSNDIKYLLIHTAFPTLGPIKNHYAHAEANRTHLFKATLNLSKTQNCFFLDNEEKKLTGDALKGKILEKFRIELENCITSDDFKDTVNRIRGSEEYQIIKKSQGLGLRETDSHKALRSMISQRGSDLNVPEPEQLLTLDKDSRLPQKL